MTTLRSFGTAAATAFVLSMALRSVALAYDLPPAPAQDENYVQAKSKDEPAPGPAGPLPDTLHAAWCSGRYKSYDPQTDTFVSDNNFKRKCVSPYSEEESGEAN
ncbi:BA14K family protein [Afifella marina]|uniref:Lectin-like protein BA14k n=1 Tax=Afifella marina DSM 2698 TaxID=1120955 RepID=A0A1G5P6I4_AFIMA|nr:BA14K family protein [Afifella marina]SCZ45162.1 BA14K-like protein [Afifella marina DSM 2698]